MLEIGTSGSVRGGDGNILTYSAFDLAQRREKSSEYGPAGECGVVAEELEAVGLVRRREHLQEEPAEQPRKHANGEEEGRPACDPALALVAQAAARHDHVHVRMVGHCRAPAVQHGGDADPGAEMSGIGCDRERGLGRRLEQEIVDHGTAVMTPGVAALGREAVDRIVKTIAVFDDFCQANDP